MWLWPGSNISRENPRRSASSRLCDVHNDGQEGLLVQKLCNISGGGHFKNKQASLASQKIMVDYERGDFQASFPDIFADYQGVGQLATRSDDLVAVPTELRGLVRDSWLQGLCR